MNTNFDKHLSIVDKFITAFVQMDRPSMRSLYALMYILKCYYLTTTYISRSMHSSMDRPSIQLDFL